MSTPVTSPVAGFSTSAARASEAEQKVKLISSTIKELVDWSSQRKKAARRTLGITDERKVTEMLAEIADKLDFLDAEKEHLTSSLAAAHYEKGFRATEIAHLQRSLHVISDKIETNSHEYAKSLEQETENLRRFRLFITESLKNPILADIIREMDDESKDQRQAERDAWLAGVVSMIEDLQAPIFNICDDVVQKSLSFTKLHVESGLAQIQDVTRGKLDELQARMERALEPIESLDAEEWRVAQEKLAALTEAEGAFKQRLDIENELVAQVELRAKQAEQDADAQRGLLRVTDDTCAVLVAELLQTLSRQRQISQAWSRAHHILSVKRLELQNLNEILSHVTQQLSDRENDVVRQERFLEKSKRIIQEKQTNEERLESQIQIFRIEEEQAKESLRTQIEDSAEKLNTAQRKFDDDLDKVQTQHEMEHSGDILAIQFEDDQNMANLLGRMQGKEHELQQSMAKAGDEIRCLQQKLAVAESNLQESGHQYEVEIERLRGIAASDAAAYEQDLSQLSRQVEEAKLIASEEQVAHKQVMNEAAAAYEQDLSQLSRQVEKAKLIASEEQVAHKQVMNEAAAAYEQDLGQLSRQLEEAKLVASVNT